MTRQLTVAVALTMMVFAVGIGAKDKDKKPDDRVAIYVSTGVAEGGFTDPSKARQDSAKDLMAKLKDSKYFRPVAARAEAVVTVDVLARETKREVNGWSALSGTGQNKSSVTVRLTVGEFTTEFEGVSGSKGMLTGHGDAAGKVAKQLDEWAKANLDRLKALAPRVQP